MLEVEAKLLMHDVFKQVHHGKPLGAVVDIANLTHPHVTWKAFPERGVRRPYRDRLGRSRIARPHGEVFPLVPVPAIYVIILARARGHSTHESAIMLEDIALLV